MKKLLEYLSGTSGRQLTTAFMMGGPALILLLVFMIYPFIRGIELSRTDRRFDGSDPNDVGWDNYDSILSLQVIELPDVPDEVPLAAREAGTPLRFADYPCAQVYYFQYDREEDADAIAAARAQFDPEMEYNTITVTGRETPVTVGPMTTVEVETGETPVEDPAANNNRLCTDIPDGGTRTVTAEVPQYLEQFNQVYYLGELGASLPGWYLDKQDDLRFGWRDLETLGLEEYADYQIWERFQLAGDTHYAILAKDPRFWRALFHNFYFVLIVVPIQTAFALMLAILINQRLRGMNVYRTIYFSPVVTAMAVIAVVWEFLYNPTQGLINETLSAISAGRLGDYGWLTDPAMAMPAIMLVSVWQGVGFQMIIFLAGLQDIPEDLYEAASIDGAGVVGKFRFVTLPMLRNTMIFVVLTTTILAFRLFDQVQVMTPEGGPEQSTTTIVWYAIRRGWAESQIGYAAAISIIFVGLVLIVSVIQRLFLRSESALD